MSYRLQGMVYSSINDQFHRLLMLHLAFIGEPTFFGDPEGFSSLISSDAFPLVRSLNSYFALLFMPELYSLARIK
jgi:hypothetical protein